jgi:antitoxin component YwqK of YwqJK toxin-antitoxin module
MRSYLFTLLFVAPVLGYGIGNESFVAGRLDAGDDPKHTGYVDANNKKQLYWIVRGKDVPEKPEYPLEGKVEEGEYKDDRKVGQWIMYHTDGETPRLIGNFVDGRPNGPYSKINAQGTVIEKSSYNNGKQEGEFLVYHDNGNVKIQKTFNAEGKENGTSKVYYEDGTLQMEVTKVNGVATGESKTYWQDGSVKNVVVYGDGGEVISTTVVNAEPPVKQEVAVGTGGPNGNIGVSLEGKPFECEGYNKLYDKKSKDLWMDGEFKDCKLWNGKLYKYDSDGILLKFEVWKNGAYHSDGQL